MTTNTQTMKSQKVVLNVQTIIKLKSAVENAINNNINEFVNNNNPQVEGDFGDNVIDVDDLEGGFSKKKRYVQNNRTRSLYKIIVL